MTLDSTQAAGFTRCTPAELAVGTVHGLTARRPLTARTKPPRQVLSDVIRPHLERGECRVLFSGGRDSSAVLAVAVDVARCEGLPEPVPVTRVHPGHPESDESEWQRLVLDHLGVREWHRLEFRDETDLLGPVARAAVRRRGVVWPSALAVQDAVMNQFGPGPVLTGEGGDAIFGARRGTVLNVLRSRRWPRSDMLRLGVLAIAPRALRARHLRRVLLAEPWVRWVQPAALGALVREVSQEDLSEPLRHDEAIWHLARRRMFPVMVRNSVLSGAEYGQTISHPLLAEEFLVAWAHEGGRRGFQSRTHAMRHIFGDLLPDAVLARRSKASFNTAYRGPDTLWFASQWDGTGVDAELINADGLRQAWLSDSPTMSAALLLHTAWLACGSPEP